MPILPFRDAFPWIAGVITIAVVGCASAPTQWVSASKPAVELARDLEFCQVEAKARVQRAPLSESNVNLTGLASIFRIMEQSSLDRQYDADLQTAIAECMKARGWSRP